MRSVVAMLVVSAVILVSGCAVTANEHTAAITLSAWGLSVSPSFSTKGVSVSFGRREIVVTNVICECATSTSQQRLVHTSEVEAAETSLDHPKEAKVVSPFIDETAAPSETSKPAFSES